MLQNNVKLKNISDLTYEVCKSVAEKSMIYLSFNESH